MSVLIRGMELPDNCGACPLETDYGTCGYYSLFVEAGHDSEIWKRRDDCPLVEVPPHGRLIDADVLERDGWYLMRVNIKDGKYEAGRLTIAPTVIEADYPPSTPLEQVWTELFGEDECKVCANADNEYCFACDNGNQFKPITQKEEDE